MGGVDQWFVKVSWLEELVSVFSWAELDRFSLGHDEVSISEFWDVYGFSIALGSHLLVFRVMFLFCWRISMMFLALDLIGSWVELGFFIGMESLE